MAGFFASMAGRSYALLAGEALIEVAHRCDAAMQAGIPNLLRVR